MLSSNNSSSSMKVFVQNTLMDEEEVILRLSINVGEE